MKAETVKYIVCHCADTPAGREFNAADIDTWHKLRGFNKIGYHWVILLDGTIEQGRQLNEVGAGVKGFNKSAIHICYIGGANCKDTRTDKQKTSLIYLIGMLKRMCVNAVVVGHRDFPNVAKSCPNFNPKFEYLLI